MTTTPAKRPTTRQLQEQIQQRDDTLELLQESIADLQLALEDQGWQRVLSGDGRTFTRAGVVAAAEMGRIYGLKNPLIKRGLKAQVDYVFGQGYTIQAKDDAVNAVVQAFLDDVKNQQELTSDLAIQQKERELGTDGNLFFVLFVTPTTGRVRLRSIALQDVDDILCNPDDAKEPQYYRRVWTETRLDVATGRTETAERTAYYPDWQYRPTARPATIGGSPVHWDSPVMHVKTGGYSDWKFGLSEIYAAIDWARAYKEFLEDWATITRAYSRFAWQMTTPGGKKGVVAAKARLGTTASATNRETNPPATVGSTFIAAEGVDLNPVRTAGATTKMEDGRRLLLMVAAAMNLPETFFGDVSVGTLATATSLDRPTELAMRTRQTLWAGILEQLLLFVVTWAVRAPQGPLRGAGAIVRDATTGTETVAWKDDTDLHIEISFPPLVQTDPVARLGALKGAESLIPDRILLARLALSTLGEDDLDTLLATMFTKDGLPAQKPIEQPQSDAGVPTSSRGGA